MGGAVLYIANQIYYYLALNRLRRIHKVIEKHFDPKPGDVFLSYTTCHGFLLWYTEIQVEAILPIDSANKILNRLLLFNLVFLPFSYSFPILIPWAIIEYVLQRLSLARQFRNGGFSQEELDDLGAEEEEVETENSDPSRHRIATNTLKSKLIGRAAIAFAVFLMVISVLLARSGQTKGSICCGLLIVLLIWVSQDRLGPSEKETIDLY